MEVLLYQACENGLTLGHALQVCSSVVQSFLSICCQNCGTMIYVQCNVNHLLPNVAFSKAILLHAICMSHSMSILSGKYTYPFFRHICQKRILQSHHQFHGLALFQYCDFLH